MKDKEKALQLTPVSRETQSRLERFVDYLLERQKTLNLIGPATIPEIWTRHVSDSLQLLQHGARARLWVDVGSGSGFPGVALACALADADHGIVHLVESIGKKADFLREAVRIAGVPAIVHHDRIEKFGESFGDKPDVVTARAVAPLKRLLDQTFPLLRRGAIGMFMKGQDVDAELTEAAKYWSIDYELLPSVTSATGKILKVVHCERRNPSNRKSRL